MWCIGLLALTANVALWRCDVMTCNAWLQGPLRAGIEALASSLTFPLKKLYVMVGEGWRCEGGGVILWVCVVRWASM